MFRNILQKPLVKRAHVSNHCLIKELSRFFIVIINNSKIITNTDYEKSLFEISSKLDMLLSHADKLDYFIAVASGLLCGMMDVLSSR